MGRKDVPVKTAEGAQEIKARALGLAPRIRTALLLVDGVKSVAELERLMTAAGVTPGALQLLLDKGLIRFPEDAPATVTTQAQPEPGELVGKPAVVVPAGVAAAVDASQPPLQDHGKVEIAQTAPTAEAPAIAAATRSKSEPQPEAVHLPEPAPAPAPASAPIVAPVLETAPAQEAMPEPEPEPEPEPCETSVDILSVMRAPAVAMVNVLPRPMRDAMPPPPVPIPDAIPAPAPLEVVTLLELETILGDVTKLEMEAILDVATMLEATPTQVLAPKTAVKVPLSEEHLPPLAQAERDFRAAANVQKLVIPAAVLHMNLTAARAHLANAIDLYLEIDGYALKQKVIACESRAELEQLFRVIESSLMQKIGKAEATRLMGIATALLDR